MQEIKAKLEELEQLFKDYKPTKAEERAYSLSKSYISLALNAASYVSRVKQGDPQSTLR